MGINGSFYGKTSNSAIKPKITWEAVADEAGNYSDVTATLSYSRKDSYETYGHWEGSLTIDEDTASVTGHYMVISKDSNTVAITHTVRVLHNDNGSRTVTVCATGEIPGTTLTKTTISAELTLEDIPRAASIAASDGDIGSTVMVTVGRKSEAHCCTVTWQFGSLSGNLAEKSKAACLAFSLPESFYGELPEASTGLCTLSCTTYLDDTPIGTAQQTAFTVRANPDRCGPLLTATVVDCNPTTLELTGEESRLVLGQSTALCTLQAQARYGAALVQKKIAEQEIEADTLYIPNIQQESVRFWVRDSRGYTAQAVMGTDMIPYFSPVVRLRAVRNDPISGEGLLTAEGSFYSGSFGAVTNSLSLYWQLNDGPWQEVVPTLDGNGFTCRADLSGMDYTRSHTITLAATDLLGTVTAQADIQPGIPVFDWGREDFAFHVPVYVQDTDILQELSALKERSGSLSAPQGATAGQYLRIRAVNGDVLETEGVDQPTMIPLTQAEYDALTEKDETVLYMIVRDST